jgi:hypothetical protein
MAIVSVPSVFVTHSLAEITVSNSYQKCIKIVSKPVLIQFWYSFSISKLYQKVFDIILILSNLYQKYIKSLLGKTTISKLYQIGLCYKISISKLYQIGLLQNYYIKLYQITISKWYQIGHSHFCDFVPNMTISKLYQNYIKLDLVIFLDKGDNEYIKTVSNWTNIVSVLSKPHKSNCPLVWFK